MTNRHPVFSDRHKICIICEGSEEYEYLEQLNSLKVWNEQYEDIKRRINEFHGVDTAADAIVIYGNPCTMQIILCHWSDISLRSPAKKVNAPLIEEFTGVENYKGRADQRKKIMNQITFENYQDMSVRVKRMDDVDTIVGSSNFGRFMMYLEEDDVGWIDEINAKLE